MPAITRTVTRRRGRPPKFTGPSRAVTLTLPEDVLEALAAIDPDISRAIVRVAQTPAATASHASAELAAFGHKAVILVRRSRALERQTGVFLVPLPDGRALISFDDSKTIPELELQLQDVLDAPGLAAADRRVFAQIAGILRDARRSSGVKVRRRNIIVLESDHPRPRRAAAGRTPARTPRRIAS